MAVCSRAVTQFCLLTAFAFKPILGARLRHSDITTLGMGNWTLALWDMESTLLRALCAAYSIVS